MDKGIKRRTPSLNGGRGYPAGDRARDHCARRRRADHLQSERRRQARWTFPRCAGNSWIAQAGHPSPLGILPECKTWAYLTESSHWVGSVN